MRLQRYAFLSEYQCHTTSYFYYLTNIIINPPLFFVLLHRKQEITMHKSFTFLVKVFTTIQRVTKKASKHVGLPFVYGGVLLLAIFYFTGLTNYNWLTLLPVLCILAGIVGYVKSEKRKGAY